jgi:hypothetical protein
MNRVLKLFFLVAFILGLGACTPRKLIINEMTQILETGVYAFEQDDDLTLIKEAFPANIKFMEALLANDPDNVRLLVLLARAYASYAFGFIEGELEEAAFNVSQVTVGSKDISFIKDKLNRYYRKGAEYALRAMEVRHPECRRQLDKVFSIDTFLAKLEKAEVPALFWYGFNLSAYVNQNRDSIRIVSKGYVVEKAMKRIIELDPSYFYGGAHLVLLAYYASRSPMMGGNLDLALMHYQKLKSITGPGFLLADLYYARFYLYQIQARAKYVQVLKDIIQHPETEKTYRFYNKIAAKRARIYLNEVDQLFG